MKSEAIRKTTEAHGWVGVIISVALFIIFWAGSITLFHPELTRWQSLPHFPLNSNFELRPLNLVVDRTLEQHNFNSSQELRIHLPGEHAPFTEMRIPIIDAETEKTKSLHLFVNPYTGETLIEKKQFVLADFLYTLHFNLKLPFGKYIVGIVTLFFLVMIMTGLTIQLKKLIRYFFLYRHDKSKRTQYTDIHNVIGVISLPYSLIYAVTGLMLNLGIVFQVATMFLTYEGDREAMLKDAGFFSYQEKPAEKNLPTPNLDKLIQRVERDYQADIHSISIKNYGDEKALINLRGIEKGSFSKRIDVNYRVKEADFPLDFNPEKRNTFSDGTAFLFSLHFGSFAGIDLRIIYFLLGLSMCGMIVVGNILWVVKRQRYATQYKRSLTVVSSMTLGGCVGVVNATALAFLLERVLPVGWEARNAVIEWGFSALFIAAIVAAFAYIRKLKTEAIKIFLQHGAFLCATLFAFVAWSDLALFGEELITLWRNGYMAPAGVTIAVTLVSASLFKLGLTLQDGPIFRGQYDYKINTP